MTNKPKEEFSEKNMKLIREWDNKIKVKELQFNFSNEGKESVIVGLKDSPFDDYVSRGELDLNALPKSYRKILSFVMRMLVNKIEENINNKGE